MAEPTRLEPATFAVTGRRSNQLSYDSTKPIIRYLELFGKPNSELLLHGVKMTHKDYVINNRKYRRSDHNPANHLENYTKANNHINA